MQLVTALWFPLSSNVASSTTPGFVVTVDYIHVFTSGLVLLYYYLADDTLILGVDPLGYSVFQNLPSLFPPPFFPPTNYQTEGSGARLSSNYAEYRLSTKQSCVAKLSKSSRHSFGLPGNIWTDVNYSPRQCCSLAYAQHLSDFNTVTRLDLGLV